MVAVRRAERLERGDQPIGSPSAPVSARLELREEGQGLGNPKRPPAGSCAGSCRSPAHVIPTSCGLANRLRLNDQIDLVADVGDEGSDPDIRTVQRPTGGKADRVRLVGRTRAASRPPPAPSMAMGPRTGLTPMASIDNKAAPRRNSKADADAGRRAAEQQGRRRKHGDRREAGTGGKGGTFWYVAM
jgi:hypothetical protein